MRGPLRKSADPFFTVENAANEMARLAAAAYIVKKWGVEKLKAGMPSTLKPHCVLKERKKDIDASIEYGKLTTFIFHFVLWGNIVVIGVDLIKPRLGNPMGGGGG